MVQHIECSRKHHAPTEIVNSAIGKEHADQTDIFERQRAPLAPDGNGFPHQGGEEDVGDVVDQEQRRDLVHLEAEALDHHEGGEHHENLTPRTRHKLQRIVQPIPAAQHELLQLRLGAFELRIGEIGEDRDGQRGAARDHVDKVVAQVEGLPRQHQKAIANQRCRRPDRHDPAQHLRRLLLVDPLQLKRLVHGLEIVKPDRAEHGDGQDATKAGKPRGDRRGRTQKRQRYNAQNLFPKQHQQGNDTNGQEARNFAHGVQPTDLDPGEVRRLDHEVVQKRRPSEERNRHPCRHQHQQEDGAPPEGQRASFVKGQDLVSHPPALRPKSSFGERKSHSQMHMRF